MSPVVQPLPMPGASPLLVTLLEVVRPEFQAELIRIDPDHPVFARGRCAVEGCERGGWSKQLCDAHYNRWRLGGRPPLEAYYATTGPITSRGALERTDAFDLRELALQLRLEVAYSIQRRHDERRVRLIPVMIHQLVALLADAQATSLLDRPVEDWVAEAIATGRARTGSRTIGQLRYASTSICRIWPRVLTRRASSPVTCGGRACWGWTPPVRLARSRSSRSRTRGCARRPSATPDSGLPLASG